MNTKTQVFFVLMMNALLIIIKGQELSCLSCEGIYDPKLCKRVKDCNVGERCGTQKINNEFGKYVFNLGCLSEKVCESYLPLNDTESTNTCYECCETNLCNLNGCGTTGYPTDRPPVCYGCSQLTPSGQCHDIDACSDGEVCSIIGMMMFDVPFPVFETRCLNRDLCARHVNTTARNKRSNEQQICEACCSQDLCNKDCRINESSLESNMTAENQELLEANATSVATTISEAGTTKLTTAVPETIEISENDLFLLSNTTEEPNTASGTLLTQTNVGIDTGNDSVTETDDANEPTDCYDIYKRNEAMNLSLTYGIYNVTTWKTKTRIQVMCMSGWTVFQKRSNGSVNFTRNFSDYKQGFGDINGEFWLGLDLIREMTVKSLSVLSIAYSETTQDISTRTFNNFSLGAGEGFTLHIGEPFGGYDDNDPIEYRFNEYHNGQNFSTFDYDADSNPDGNCAKEYRGGWWYNNCTLSNLNGEYETTDNKTRMTFADIGFDENTFQNIPKIFNLRISDMMFSQREFYDKLQSNHLNF